MSEPFGCHEGVDKADVVDDDDGAPHLSCSLCIWVRHAKKSDEPYIDTQY